MITTGILRRPRVLIVGCGDIGLRCAALLLKRARIFALTRQPAHCASLRAAGATPIIGDLDARASLRRLAGLAPTVLHLVPPQPQGTDDRRTRALIATLTARRRSPARPASIGRQRLFRGSPLIVPDGLQTFACGERRAALRVVYASTTGVYGDCGSARIDETRRARPVNARAKRRLCAEQQLRRATANGTLHATIARIPGIYAANRLPSARLAKQTPALADADDVYTNHIHADDLAAILVRMMTHGRPARIVHASDDSELKMGDYFDRVADALGVARVPRVGRAQAERELDPVQLSFMRESRRLSNARLKRELRVRLRYPCVDDFLRMLPPSRV